MSILSVVLFVFGILLLLSSLIPPALGLLHLKRIGRFIFTPSFPWPSEEEVNKARAELDNYEKIQSRYHIPSIFLVILGMILMLASLFLIK
jgi:hypothetical protein